MRRQRLVQWALANRQIDFLDWLGERTFEDDTWRQLLQSSAVAVPPCAAYPTSLALVWSPGIGDPVTSPDHVQYFFAAQYSGPCAIDVPTGSVALTTTWVHTRTILVAGRDFQDDVIGSVWRGYVSDCVNVRNHPDVCGRPT
jgi:hypothetical protein